MSKKENTVSVAMMDKISKSYRAKDKVIVYQAGEEVIEVTVMPNISFKSRCAMVSEIIDMCFVGGKYVSGMKTFAINYNLLAYHTNLALGDSVEKIWSFINASMIIEKILEVMVDGYYQILDEVESGIKYRIDSELAHNKSDDLMDAIVEVVNKISGMVTDFSNSINIEDIINIGKSLAEKDESEIVKSILDYQKAHE